jgi:hypothetical protein
MSIAHRIDAASKLFLAHEELNLFAKIKYNNSAIVMDRVECPEGNE